MATSPYVGTELETFALARRWKSYCAGRLAPDVVGDVLEVGAGIGGTTRALSSGKERSWHCLEPDPALAARLRASLCAAPLAVPTRVDVGTVADLPPPATFDTILYIDVLEHIADDREEIARAAEHLRPGGALIALCPAHQSLFSAFDAAIGHHRRYDARKLRALTPPALALPETFYLDAAGMLLSLANRLLLRSAHPSARQIALWDRYVVPVSRVLDPLLGRRVGKTVVAIWRRR